MAVELVGLDRITEPVRPAVEEYARLVSDLGGANAKALTLFGAITAEGFAVSRHLARSVLVVDHVDLGMLRRLAAHGTKLGKARIAAPLIMTPDYIKASLDTFPLELIEIKEQHMTVFGEDLFEGLSFEDAHVRLQCERELKVISIGLRQGLLAAAGREKLLGGLARDTGEGLLRTLRGILWLNGQREGKAVPELLSEIEKATGETLSGIRTALDHGAEHGWPEFESLYADVQTLEKIADAL